MPAGQDTRTEAGGPSRPLGLRSSPDTRAAGAAVRMEGLTRYYGRRRGIEDLDLDVHQGEIFGFLGPNGAGKTTTLRLLLDLIRPSRGKAVVLGLDVRRHGIRVRRRTGYLPGEFGLYENLSGGRFLAFMGRLRGRTDLSYARGLAGRFQADLARPIRDLSHGNKQKLALIQALMHRPPILILDEPTLGLDPLLQQEFYGLLQKVREDGSTVLLSSHNLTEVERMCDRVASIRNGRLVAVDDIAGLRREALRIVQLRTARAIKASAFERLPSLNHVRVDGKVLCCTVRGALGELVTAAAHFGIEDMFSREPSLEEFFLSRYGERTDHDDR
jgi:ABC-2 type transport system ATP-binding protein